MMIVPVVAWIRAIENDKGELLRFMHVGMYMLDEAKEGKRFVVSDDLQESMHFLRDEEAVEILCQHPPVLRNLPPDLKGTLEELLEGRAELPNTVMTPDSPLMQQLEGRWQKIAAMLLWKTVGREPVTVELKDMEEMRDEFAPGLATIFIHGHANGMDFRLIPEEEAEEYARLENEKSGGLH